MTTKTKKFTRLFLCILFLAPIFFYQVYAAIDRNSGLEVDKTTRCVAEAEAADRLKIKMKPSTVAAYTSLATGERGVIKCEKSECTGLTNGATTVQKDNLKDQGKKGVICCTKIKNVRGRKTCIGNEQVTDEVEKPINFAQNSNPDTRTPKQKGVDEKMLERLRQLDGTNGKQKHLMPNLDLDKLQPGFTPGPKNSLPKIIDPNAPSS